MPARETRIKPALFPVIGGVQQRTELLRDYYASLEGVFPEFAGLQGRIWGKRLFEAYDESVYGIHQMWSPLGYGGGIYQFDDNIKFGPWKTPTTSFDFEFPDIPFDITGRPLDEFGYPRNTFNKRKGIRWINLSSYGGPAQGSVCVYIFAAAQTFTLPPISFQQYGYSSDEVRTDVGPPPPYPIYPSKRAIQPSEYFPNDGPFPGTVFASCDSYSAKINLGGGVWREFQGYTAQNTRAKISFAGIFDPSVPPPVVEFIVRHGGNAPFTYTYQAVPGLIYGPNSNFTSYSIEAWDYLQPNYGHNPNPLGGGFVNGDFVAIEGVRIKYIQKVCNVPA